MNYKSNLKVKHETGELIIFIECNDYEGFVKIIQDDFKLLRKKKMDDNEPIFHSIKFKNNKIFKFILEKSMLEDIKYDVMNMFNI
jgi:arabinogalactan endo-1,4-beta-galactosidase